MITFPNAKINLGLQITGKRSDGYHLIESAFYSIPLRDVLEVLPSSSGTDSLMVYGGVEAGPSDDNLVLRAVRKLRERITFPAVEIHLQKNIPSGAGMGGGSADATFMLRTLCDLFDLNLSDDELRTIALSLGADCPYFVVNTPCLVEGIGEIFTPAPELSLSGYHILVVKPSVHISTAEAFRGLTQIGGHSERITDTITSPIDTWQGRLINDFESSLFPKYPELERIKRHLLDLGAIYASMTGSGAALYGLFHTPIPHCKLSTFSNHFLWQSVLS